MTDRETLSQLISDKDKYSDLIFNLKNRIEIIKEELKICDNMAREFELSVEFEKEEQLAFLTAFRSARKNIETINTMKKMLVFDSNKTIQDIAYNEQIVKSIQVRIDYVTIKIRYMPIPTTECEQEFKEESYNVG